MIDTSNKIKILLLDTYEERKAAHMAHTFDLLPEAYEKRMVVKKGAKWFEPYAMYYWRNFLFQAFDEMCRFFAKRRMKKHYGEPLTMGGDEYHFYGIHPYAHYSGKDILKKCKGFMPDVICVYYAARFISPKTIRELYDLTHAHIVLIFFDEQHLAGGCHYHCDCKGYLSTCENCPALLTSKELAHDQMVERIQMLKEIPITLVGTPFDLETAKQTKAYQHASTIELIAHPRVSPVSQETGRARFGIGKDDYVVLLGAAFIHETRKGIKYAVEAINKFANEKQRVTLLLLGNITVDITFNEFVKVITPGFVNVEDLVKAFCASNVLISPSLADSGPFMVNYAVALGIPVVSFNIGVAHTLIAHKETGYIAEFKSSDSLAEGLKFTYQMSPERRSIISQQLIAMMDKYKDNGAWYDQFLIRWQSGEFQ